MSASWFPVDRDELELFVAALDRGLLDRADAADVELVVDHAGLERGPLLGLHGIPRRDGRNRDRSVPFEDLEVVLRLALEELLAEALAGLRMGGHEDPRLGAVPACEPRAARVGQVAVAVKRLGRLAEVDHVATLVLGVPIRRLLGQLAACLVEPVVDDRGRDAADLLGPVGDLEDVRHLLAVPDSRVGVGSARRKREPRVRDVADVLRRLERRRAVAVGLGPRRAHPHDAGNRNGDHGDQRDEPYVLHGAPFDRRSEWSDHPAGA